MSFLSGFFKKFLKSKNREPVALEQEAEDGKTDTDVIVPNTARSIKTLVEGNENTASAASSGTKPEGTKSQHKKTLKVNILDAGRTLVFSTEGTQNNGELPGKVVKKEDMISSVMTADLPKGLTTDFVQQLLRTHETEKASQAAPTTPENTFTPFIFILTCQQCGVNGEIAIYTETYICPKCGGKMVLREIRVDESKLKMPETEKIVSEFWENYTKDLHAKRQWDLLTATNKPAVIDLLRRISRNTPKISTVQRQLPLRKTQSEKVPVFSITTLPDLIRHASVLSKRFFCDCCQMSFSYPEIMNGGNIMCPKCHSSWKLPGVTKKYNAVGHIKKDGENIPIGIRKKSTSQLCLLYEVAKTLQTELDYAMNPFRILFSSHKFDLLNSFDEFFSKETFYKNELAVFSLIKLFFTLYKRCWSDADIKFFSNTIIMYENRKDQVLFLPSMVLQKIDSEIICSRLDSISVTVSENITSKLIASAYRTTWLHTRKDGGPDRRYSDNPKKKIPTAYDLIADISYSCTLKIGPRSWVCYVTENTVEQLISFINSWNKLSTDL